jgi:polynucleotide 5'-hydroxyl-kinase GRC3/NOL9
VEPAAVAPDLPVPEEWIPGLDALQNLPDGAAALLVGATDRGKTTFAALAAQRLAFHLGNNAVAVVDADVGQSEIGPPGTVGVAWARPDVPRLHDLKPAARFFVGAFAPGGVALEHAAATGQAVAWARERDAARILIDTTGFVAGPAARRLKVAKAQLARPALLLGFARAAELDPLLSVLAAATGAAALALPVPEAVGRKSPTLRATRRMTRAAEALEGARPLRLPFSEIATVGATLGTGEPQPPHLVRWIGNALRFAVVHAERDGGVGGGTLALWVDGPPPRGGWESIAAPVAEHFGVKTVRALSLRAHRGLFLGLHDAGGRLLSVGRFLQLDPAQGELVVAAPPPASAERVRLVAFGRVRLGDDGAPAADIKPGEI